LVTYNINRCGEITTPPTFTIATRNLITVLLITTQRHYRLLERPSNANTPRNMHEELGESNSDYENIPLNFARERGLTPASDAAKSGVER
jgi:hypothetical protein